jgi:hypothetical protein
LSNSIFSNGVLGIDLGEDGVTANDQRDTDTGPNNLQNYPDLGSSEISKNRSNHKQRVEVEGILKSAPRATFMLQFFASAACDPSHFGEGDLLIGATSVKTDKNGRAHFHVSFFTTLPQVKFITSTATDSNGNTSEFSQCERVKQ